MTQERHTRPDNSPMDWEEWQPKELWQVRADSGGFAEDDELLGDDLGDLDLEAFAGSIEQSIKEAREAAHEPFVEVRGRER